MVLLNKRIQDVAVCIRVLVTNITVAEEGLQGLSTYNFLGELKDELDGSAQVVIGEWVCGAPKNGYSS